MYRYLYIYMHTCCWYFILQQSAHFSSSRLCMEFPHLLAQWQLLGQLPQPVAFLRWKAQHSPQFVPSGRTHVKSMSKSCQNPCWTANFAFLKKINEQNGHINQQKGYIGYIGFIFQTFSQVSNDDRRAETPHTQSHGRLAKHWAPACLVATAPNILSLGANQSKPCEVQHHLSNICFLVVYLAVLRIWHFFFGFCEIYFRKWSQKTSKTPSKATSPN